MPWFSVTRLTASALPLNEWVSRCCKALTLPHLPSCVAFTIRAWRRRTFDSTVWLAVVVTGIGCSAIAFSLSAWAQRTIDPARASILNLLEPVVAGFVGYTVGERLGVEGYFGAFLILAGIVVAELGTHRASRRLARAAADT